MKKFFKECWWSVRFMWFLLVNRTHNPRQFRNSAILMLAFAGIPNTVIMLATDYGLGWGSMPQWFFWSLYPISLSFSLVFICKLAIYLMDCESQFDWLNGFKKRVRTLMIPMEGGFDEPV